ncbi:MAG: PAS domain S-box protein [Aphanothece sp. CMT-3BRIN-NPC111]|jgi:PAS domain S-box-containing protein|nr:PAS domain S-box protein [Aphanothece sp. CMT-3BRIN-NPC111]
MNNQPLKNEATRFVALDQYQILDTEPEAAFDDIARLATLVCGTPIALINLIDGNRQWFKSNIGLNVKELPLVAGFCRICIEQRDVLLIPDTLADEQFAINLVVQNHPHVRFYAGAPLITPDGNAIGTLCAIDTKPRQFSIEQVEALRALSRQVVNLLELRRHVTKLESMIALYQVTESALQESEERYRSVVTAMHEGIVLHQTDGSILTCNPSAERILGLSAEELVGRTSLDLYWRTVHPDDSLFPQENYPVTLTLRTGKPCSNVVMKVHKPDGGLSWISVNSQPLCSPGETIPYAVVASFSDITAQKLAEAALQQANETLELKVQERTVLLQQAIEQLETEAGFRMQAEETLNKEREFLKALLENLADGIVACDENGILTLFNRATREFHGMPQQPLSPEEWAQFYDLYLPDGCTPMQKEDIPLFQAWQGKTVRDVEMVIVPRQGKVRTVLASGQAIIDPHKKKLGAVVVMHDITARKAIEAALIESESRLNSILNSIQDAVWSVSFDTFEVVYLNPATEKLHARSRQDFFDNPYLWYEVIHPDDRDSVENYMKKLLETGSIEHEYRIIRADGEVRWVYDKGWLVYDHTGKPVRIDGLASDITERKIAEKTAARLTTILEATPDFVSFADAETQRILYLNKAGRQIVGIEENEDVTTLRISDFVPELVRQFFFNESLPTAVEQGTWSGETFLRHQSGRGIPVSQVLMSHKAENGEVETISTIIRDISEQKAAELALRQSQAFLAESQKVARVGCWGFDLATQVVTWSEELFRIFGLEPSFTPLAYKDYLDKVHPDDVGAIAKAVEVAIAEGKSYELDQRIVLPDGSSKYVSAQGLPIFNAEGQLIKLFGTVLDITERKQAEDNLKASLQEKETLLKEIHHRVKNNLQIISSLLRLQSKHIRDADVLELFQESQNRVRTMALIHEKLYQSGNLAKIDFIEYIQTLVQELSRSYGASRQAIAFKLTIEKVHLEVDIAIPCGLIINELVSNSLKYAFKDCQTGEIDISLVQHSESHRFILTIGDNGVGLPQNLDFRKTQSLGLQLVCRLTKQLGGSINLTHRQGTAFQIIFAAPNDQEYN